jgi:hypothetical protein
MRINIIHVRLLINTPEYCWYWQRKLYFSVCRHWSTIATSFTPGHQISIFDENNLASRTVVYYRVDKKPTNVTFVLSFISLLQVVQHVSGKHVPIFRSWRLRNVIATCWYCAVAARTPQWTHYLLTGLDGLPAATTQYQQVAITLRSRELLKMGTWLPETCWTTCKREIKDNTKVTSSWFPIHTIVYCVISH